MNRMNLIGGIELEPAFRSVREDKVTYFSNTSNKGHLPLIDETEARYIRDSLG